jgi:DNA-directed RNA polymerase subunit H (RpoH/RPB5)
MQTFSAFLGLALALSAFSAFGRTAVQQTTPVVRQLSAVRGEIVRMKTSGKGMLLITVKPAKDFAEITVLARENDLVGNAVGRAGESDLLGLLSDDARDEETITAAELSEGDVVSVIYDPQSQNRVMEIYVH